MKWTLAAFAALAVAAFLTPAFQAGSGAAVAATPTPAALQYDEITRMVFPPATPPAPGTFAVDYQLAAAATPAPKAPSFNFGTMLNPAAARAYAEQMQQMAFALHLVRYTFYRGWIRRDDPVARTATIEKCDQHQYVKLDLANKTYATITAQAACSTPMQPMGAPMQASREAPGTVDLTTTATSKNLGPMTIDGVATTGWDRSVDVKMSNATGSCRNGDFNMNVTQYVSNVNVPHRFCPLPHGMNPLEAAGAVQGGCKPAIAGAQSGDFNLDTMGIGVGSGDALVMFSGMSTAAGPKNGAGMFVERGNVKWLGGADAASLFEIPAAFTQGS